MIRDNAAEVKQHARMVALVERMLSLHRRAGAAAQTSQVLKTCEVSGGGEVSGGKVLTPQEQERLAREIAATDREIDALVYALYGLTEEEIKIVEGG